MSENYNIFAFKTDEAWCEKLYNSIKQNGKARFGWSYIKNGDLRIIKEKIEKRSWEKLSDEEKDIWSVNFLLSVKKNDFIVYINMPEYGKCTVCEVTGEYYWNYWGDDFNHCFDVKYIGEFDRNDRMVHPYLSQRLKLQGRYWRIYAVEEFEDLLKHLKTSNKEDKTQTEEDRIELLKDKLKDTLNDIVEQIYKTHPNKDLEELVVKLFEKIPNVQNVRQMKGRSDQGADILFEYETNLGINVLDGICQVKSYTGTISDIGAISDLERAFEVYKNARIGLIITTATDKSPEFDIALDKLIKESGKEIGVILGPDLAKMFLKYHL